MASRLYPRKLLAFASRGTLSRLPADERVGKLSGVLADGLGVVARVLIDTDLPVSPDPRWTAVAPVSLEGKLVYPSGRFESVLTTREAEAALKVGVIADVVEVAVYELADLFSGYVARFNALKEQYSLEGSEVFRQISKMFLNNLYGKFGQLTPVDMDVSAEDLEALTESWAPDEHFRGYRSPDGRQIEVRRFMGHVSASEGRKKECATSFCAISAHIVADSRLMLRQARAFAGYDHTYYADTDSMIVDEPGYERMLEAGIIDDARLGFWKLEEEAQNVEVRAPKDYTFGGVVKRKGIRHDAVLVGFARARADDGSFVGWSASPGEGLYPVWRQSQFRSLVGALRRGDADTAVVLTVLKIATGAYSKGVPAEDGWVYPLRL